MIQINTMDKNFFKLRSFQMRYEGINFVKVKYYFQDLNCNTAFLHFTRVR